MSVDIRLVPGHNRTTLPGNTHTYQGRQIVAADKFRVDLTAIVPADSGRLRDDLEQGLQPEHVRPGRPYGLILMSSQLCDVMYLTSPALVEQYRRTPSTLPADAPVYGGWPNGSAWDKLIPATTWFPSGFGVLDTFVGVDGATVTVYEYTVDKAQAYNKHAEPSGELTAMVTYHCDRCHTPDCHDLGERFENRFPHDRFWAASKARLHARSTDQRCTLPDGNIERVVSQVASEKYGRPIVLPSRAQSCAAEDGCAQVRIAQAATEVLAPATC